MKLLLLLSTLSMVGCSLGPPCNVQFPGKIKEVGGCSRDGQCGVVMEDGTELVTQWPVVGGSLHGYGCWKR